MPTSHRLSLQVSKTSKARLQSLQQQLEMHLKECIENKKFPYFPAEMATEIQQILNQIIAANADWRAILEEVHADAMHRLLQLQGKDNFSLNQFWRLAQSPQTGQILGDISHLFLSNELANYPNKGAFTADNPLPLKILVMIASPMDTAFERLLSYEKEERLLLEAFGSLFEAGQVQIDFTHIGSLEALEEKLHDNHYHILHFSGHGTYDTKNQKGYLELEDHLTLKSKRVAASDFAEVLNRKPEHRPALVLLNSCLTAKGSADSQLSGMSNYLLDKKIPAVIAMGWSILDSYATEFAAKLYQRIAAKDPLHRAFQTALQHIRQLETGALRNNRLSTIALPLQWLMPQLYQRQTVAQLVDWTAAKAQKVKLQSFRFVSGEQQLILKRSLSAEHHFVGRREDIAKALPLLLQGKPLLLRGQGGMGKTTLAEYLVQRMIAYRNDTHPFAFDETANMDKVLQSMTQFLLKEKKQLRIKRELKHHEKGMEQFIFLLEKLTEHCQPVFVFDNLESLQSSPNAAFKDLHSDVAEIIELLYDSEYAPMLLTCRYSVKECADIKIVDLAHVSLNDFWQKIRHLELNKLANYLQRQQQNPQLLGSEKLNYKEVVGWLHHTFGGNFRALEWFDEQFQQQPKGILESIRSLKDLEQKLQGATEKVLEEMRQNLVFEQLLNCLQAEEQHCLYLLSHFETPVKTSALQLQLNAASLTYELPPILQKLQQLSLIESHQDQHYVHTLTKELLRTTSIASHPPTPFSHELAGRYYYGRFQNFSSSVTLSEIEAGLNHYLQARNIERINELGLEILDYYYGQATFRKALVYALAIEEIAKDNLETNLANRMGQLFQIDGQLDRALIHFQRNLAIQQQIGDKSGEGTTLNNISTIYQARGDYDTALTFLKQSLAIQQQIGDKSGEGTTLNNISQIYDAKGDYDTALTFLKQSLAIQQQIGDKSGEGTTLNNISQIYDAKGDYDTALTFLKQSLAIQQQIGDKSGEGTTLNNISQIHRARGDYDTALTFLKQSLAIQQQIGDKSGEGTTLNNISQIYDAKGDYDTALTFLKQSLAIQQQIGDKSGEGTTLNNISQIHRARGDYDTALTFLKQSLAIQQQIGDKSGEGTTLNNISTIYQARGDYDTALTFLKQSLAIQQQIGDKSGEGTTLNNISQIYDAKGDYDTALTFLKQSLAIRQQIGDKSGEGTTLNNISQIYDAKGDYDTALTFLKQSLAIQQQIGDKSGEGTTLNNISQIHRARGDYDTALTFLKQSLAIQQQIGDKSGEGTTLNNISQIYDAKGDYDTALTFLKQSLAIQQQIGDKSGEGTTLNNISQIYDAKGDYDTALTFLKQSLAIQQQIGDKSGEGTTLNNISQIHRARGDYDTALTFLKQSLAIQQQIGDKSGEGTTLNNISTIYQARGDYDTALTFLKQSLAIRQQIGDKSGMCPTLHNMAMISLQKEDIEGYFQQEVAAYQIAMEIQDVNGIYQIGRVLGKYMCMVGMKEQGFPILQQAFALGQQVGYPDVGEVAGDIQRFSG